MTTTKDMIASSRQRGFGQQPPSKADDIRSRLGHRKELEVATTWPGVPTIKVRLRVLMLAERQAAQDAARAATKARGAEGNADIYATELTAAVLASALVEADGSPLFASPVDLAGAVTEDEMEALAEVYMDLKRATDPAALAPDLGQRLDAAIADRDAAALVGLADALPRRALLGLLSGLVRGLAATSAQPAAEVADAG